jgi:hypothetical protein
MKKAGEYGRNVPHVQARVFPAQADHGKSLMPRMPFVLRKKPCHGLHGRAEKGMIL